MLKKDTNMLGTLHLTGGNTLKEKWHKTKKTILDEEYKEKIRQKNKAREIMIARNRRRNKKAYGKLRKDTKKILKKKKNV